MHIVLLNYGYSPGFATAEALLERYHTLIGWAEGLAAAGARVTLFQRFDRDQTIARGGITYQFVADRADMELRAWQLPLRLHRLARAAQPALVHLNGLLYPLQARALRALLPRRCALVAQHHAELPRSGVRGAVQSWGLGAIDGFLFAARELARPWLQRRMLRRSQPIYQIMEGSTRFQPGDRTAARARTGMWGDPVVLWVGRLDQNKDPLTVLDGFEQALERAPGARLYMIYSDNPLLPRVRSRVARSQALRAAVELLGGRPYREMEDYYNSADYFVLGSHHEGSGYALAEALACGLVPIVSDIPSFRVMTDGGRLGALWPVEDAGAFAAARGEVVRRPRAPLAAAARDFLEAHLSYAAIGRQALAAYHELVTRRGAQA
jgi:glycosyltransferase involved in cell wall biosynthesis